MHDGEFGQFVMPPANPATAGDWGELETGDLIEIEGRTARGGFAPNVIPEHVRKLGRAPLPHERTIAYSAMLTGRYDCDYVGVVGVVQRAWLSSDPKSRVMFADVAVEDGIVRAAFWDYASPADLTRFVDARVQLRGNIGTLFGRTEQLRGVSLFAGRIEDVTVLEAAPDPFSLPTRAIRNIYNYSSEGEVNRRIRVRGMVTARVHGTPVAMSDFTTSATFRYIVNVIYVTDGTAGVRIETEQSLCVRPGDIVEAAGFPAVTPGQADFTERLAPRCRRRNCVHRLSTSRCGRQRAHARSRRRAGAHERAAPERAGRDDGAGAGAAVRRHHLQRRASTSTRRTTALDKIRPGTLLSVTGVYSYQGGPPPSFRLLLRSAGRREGAGAGALVDDAPHGCHGRDAGTGRVRRRALDARHRQSQAAGISGGAQRADARRARAPRHRRTGPRRDFAAARSRGRQFPDRARGGAAVARRRAADAAVQPGRDEAIGDGSPVAGAGERATSAAPCRTWPGR